jgi:prevent-host-death family protein
MMAITTFSSRDLNQNVTRAKKATRGGPVFITDRGKPAHVLLSIKEYQRLAGSRQKIADLLSLPGAEDIELEIPLLRDVARQAELS